MEGRSVEEGEGIFTNVEQHWRDLTTPVMNHLWGSRHTWWSAGPLDSFWWCRWLSAVGRRPVLNNLSEKFHILGKGLQQMENTEVKNVINVENSPACMFVYSAPKCLHWNPYTGPRSPSSLSVNPKLSRKALEPLASQIFTPFSESSLAFVDPCSNQKNHHFMLSQPCKSYVFLFKSNNLHRSIYFGKLALKWGDVSNVTLTNHSSSSNIPLQKTFLVVRSGNWSTDEEQITYQYCQHRQSEFID